MMANGMVIIITFPRRILLNTCIGGRGPILQLFPAVVFAWWFIIIRLVSFSCLSLSL